MPGKNRGGNDSCSFTDGMLCFINKNQIPGFRLVDTDSVARRIDERIIQRVLLKGDYYS